MLLRSPHYVLWRTVIGVFTSPNTRTASDDAETLWHASLCCGKFSLLFVLKRPADVHFVVIEFDADMRSWYHLT